MPRTLLLLTILLPSLSLAAPSSPDDFPPGADSPEALFEKLRDAADEENWGRFLSAVHPENRLYFIGWLYGSADMRANRRAEFRPAFRTIREKHGVRPLQRDDANLFRGEPPRHKPQLAALARRAQDPLALFADVVTFLRQQLQDPRLDVGAQKMLARKDKPNGQVLIRASYPTANGGEGRVDWYTEAEYTRWYLLYYR